jgi:uncharacterized membrane protein
VGGFFLIPLFSFAQTNDIEDNIQVTAKAEVVEVVSQEERVIPGTETIGRYQTIRFRILEGVEKGKEITIENDYLNLKKGEVFYVTHTKNSVDDTDYYMVAEPYRLPVLIILAIVFVACIFIFGGIQGVRGLIALLLSMFFIIYMLLPGILAGYSPLLVSVLAASIIIILGSYITHGVNKTTSSAVIGMIGTVIVTGVLSLIVVHSARLSGFTSEESVYLNFSTRGSIDFVGLLLGGIIIGLLGILYDVAIGQAIAVEELFAAGKHLPRQTVYVRAIRMGREHIGALVNTLAIAYVGAGLPLLLLLISSGGEPLLVTINREGFATEIVRIMVGGIGIMLAVPITTAIAVFMLSDDSKNKTSVIH